MKIKIIFVAFIVFIMTNNISAQNKTTVVNTIFFGKQYKVFTNLNDGSKYIQNWKFSVDGKKLTIDIIDGPHKGLHDEVELTIMHLNKYNWFINWVVKEKNAAQGNTVSYVIDFKTKIIRAGFFTINPKADAEYRSIATATGHFIEIK